MKARFFSKSWKLQYTWEECPFTDDDCPEVINISDVLYIQFGTSRLTEDGDEKDRYLTYMQVDPLVISRTTLKIED